MYLKVELPWNVIIPPEKLDKKGLMLQHSIIIQLMEDFAKKKATKDHGYLFAVMTLERIGDGKVREQTGDVLFPVVFNCLTFKPFKGEIMHGVVYKILKQGVFLKCGPMDNVFLSSHKMLDYQYTAAENPFFLSDKHPKIEKDVTIRFRVLGTKWMEVERDFQMLKFFLLAKGSNWQDFAEAQDVGAGTARNDHER